MSAIFENIRMRHNYKTDCVIPLHVDLALDCKHLGLVITVFFHLAANFIKNHWPAH